MREGRDKVISKDRGLSGIVPAEFSHRLVNECAGRRLLLTKAPWKSIVEQLGVLTSLLGNTDELVQSFSWEELFMESELFEKEKLNEVSQTNMRELISSLIEALIPWRKGPYQIKGYEIDSEWQSQLKWQRHEAYFKKSGSLADKTVCDLGCNNGYFMFRLLSLPLECRPRYVLGLDPTLRYYLQYLFLKSFVPQSYHPYFDYYLLGYQHLDWLPSVFDHILAWGILYHHPNPLEVLKLIHASLKPHGVVWIDCQGIISQTDQLPLALFPQRTYAGKKGFWFLPNKEALLFWLERTGFRDVEFIYEEVLSTKEQRESRHTPYSSLATGLDESQRKTIEGYPEPMRYYLKAVKG